MEIEIGENLLTVINDILVSVIILACFWEFVKIVKG